MKREKSEEARELEQIKKLLVMLLIRDGATSDEIGNALGISGARVRQKFSMSKLRKTRRGESSE